VGFEVEATCDAAAAPSDPVTKALACLLIANPQISGPEGG
jgi:hypothetical protein